MSPAISSRSSRYLKDPSLESSSRLACFARSLFVCPCAKQAFVSCVAVVVVVGVGGFVVVVVAAAVAVAVVGDAAAFVVFFASAGEAASAKDCYWVC